MERILVYDLPRKDHVNRLFNPGQERVYVAGGQGQIAILVADQGLVPTLENYAAGRAYHGCRSRFRGLEAEGPENKNADKRNTIEHGQLCSPCGEMTHAR